MKKLPPHCEPFQRKLPLTVKSQIRTAQSVHKQPKVQNESSAMLNRMQKRRRVEMIDLTLSLN